MLNADCMLTAFVWNSVLSKGNRSTDIIAAIVQLFHATTFCMPATTAVVLDEFYIAMNCGYIQAMHGDSL